MQALAELVRAGVGLRQAIVEAGLPEKQTLKYLKENHRAMFKDAKSEARLADESKAEQIRRIADEWEAPQ